MRKLHLPLLFATLVAAACGTGEDEHQRAAKKKSATIRVPILETTKSKTRSGKRKTVVQPVHKKHAEIPAFVEITSDAEPFRKVSIQVETLNDALPEKDDIELIEFGVIENFHVSKTVRICYTGDAHAAIQLLLQLTDSALSDMFVLQAYRFGQGKFDGEGEKLDKDFEADLDVPEIWSEFKGLGGAILTLASASDGGEESMDGIITRCK